MLDVILFCLFQLLVPRFGSLLEIFSALEGNIRVGQVSDMLGEEEAHGLSD